MAFKNRLLATAAIPLIALTGMEPVSAASLFRPTAPIEARSDVVRVQSEDELLQEKKRERRENRQNRKEAAQDQQEEVQPRRKKQNDAEAQPMSEDAGQMQQDEQEPVKPRRKKQNDAEAQPMSEDAGQMQQDDQEPVKPRRKKQNDAEAQPMSEDAGQMQQDEQEPVKPRRKKQNDAEAQPMSEDNAGQMQQDDQEPVKPRRKKQNDAASDQNGPTDEELRKALEENNDAVRQGDGAAQDDADTGNRKRRKDRQNAQEEQPATDNGQAEEAVKPRKRDKAENPERVKEKEQIAADPSKTTDTIELPVENGAAVLDSDKDADNVGDNDSRERRKREREEVKPARLPKSDKDAQAGFREDKEIRIRPVLDEKGERLPGFKGYDDFGGRRVGDRDEDRVVITIDGRIVIRADDDNRLARRDGIRYERLSDGRIREIVIRPDGDRIVTVRNRWGEIIRRSRIDRNEREIVIFFSPDLERGRDRLFLRDPGADLPPMRLRIPVEDYIIDVSGGRDRDYEEFLDQPPVEPVERVYSVDEVKYSARIRDKMRRIDLDTITFDTGSAEISMEQASSLKQVGNAIRDILDKDPGETFLIEGHTDAVGSDESNLVLSDQRAESVANVLSDVFDIPAENLVTQGYGERYLKIDSDGPIRENRRVTIRRITPLVRPLASAEE